MALPDHVKKAAMEALGNSGTIEWIRRHNTHVTEGQIFHPKEQGMTAKVMARADTIVAACKPLKDIRLVAVNDISRPLPTPPRDWRRQVREIQQLYQQQQSLDAVHRQLTRDGFGRGE